MVTQNARALAQHYLETHKVTEGRFGLGPFLDIGEFTLLSPSNYQDTGAIILRIDSSDLLQCSSIALEMHKVILEKNPELKPKLMYYAKGNGETHCWVEVTDEKGRKIQIDGTPWFPNLDAGYAGTELKYESLPPFNYLCIERRTATPFSVKKTPVGFIDSYMCGSTALSYNGLSYWFLLVVVRYLKFGGEFEGLLSAKIIIDNPCSLQSALETAKTITELQERGVARVIIDYRKSGSSTELPLATQRERAERMGQQEAFGDVEKNLPRMRRLLEKARPQLEPCALRAVKAVAR